MQLDKIPHLLKRSQEMKSIDTKTKMNREGRRPAMVMYLQLVGIFMITVLRSFTWVIIFGLN